MSVQIRAIIKFRAFLFTFGTVDTGWITIPGIPKSPVAAGETDLFNARGVHLTFRAI